MVVNDFPLNLFDISHALMCVCVCVFLHFSHSYKLKGNTHELDSWGHEYLRALAGDIGKEHTARVMAKAADLKDMENDGAW